MKVPTRSLKLLIGLGLDCAADVPMFHAGLHSAVRAAFSRSEFHRPLAEARSRARFAIAPRAPTTPMLATARAIFANDIDGVALQTEIERLVPI